MLTITDKPVCISVETMRTHFESVIKGAPALAGNTPLGAMTVNGQFSHYSDPDTDTMWLGFALGMRCMERVAKANPQEAG